MIKSMNPMPHFSRIQPFWNNLSENPHVTSFTQTLSSYYQNCFFSSRVGTLQKPMERFRGGGLIKPVKIQSRLNIYLPSA